MLNSVLLISSKVVMLCEVLPEQAIVLYRPFVSLSTHHSIDKITAFVCMCVCDW